MATKVYFITGANRGIGRGLLDLYAQQPNNTIIAAVRDPSGAKSLLDLPTGTNTRILITKLDSASKTDAYEAAKDIQAQGITQIDVVISAAGMVTMGTVEQIPIDSFEEVLMVNGLSVMLLYKALLPLLRKVNAPAKFAFISAAGGSITQMPKYPYPNISYVASKALANAVVVKAGMENEWLITLCIHPGIVQTDMGNLAARAFGLEEAPLTLEESSTNTAYIIENSTKEEHSGKFFNETIDETLPW